MKGLRLLVLGALLMTACARPAAPGHVWNLWGTVTDFTATEMSVRHKTGRVVRLAIDGGTVFTSEKRPAGPDALAKRARVSVDVEVLADGRLRAKVVRIIWGAAAMPER